MNSSKIHKILNLFSAKLIVHIINDGVNISRIAVEDVKGDPDNEVLYIGWDGEDGEEYVAKFTEQSLNDVAIYNGNLVIVDSEGDDVEIAFYLPIKQHFTEENFR